MSIFSDLKLVNAVKVLFLQLSCPQNEAFLTPFAILNSMISVYSNAIE